MTAHREKKRNVLDFCPKPWSFILRGTVLPFAVRVSLRHIR